MAKWIISVLAAEPELAIDRRIVPLPRIGWTLIGLLLASGGHAARRARIAAALWPDSGEDAARHCLSTTLWRLKQRHPGLGGLISAEGDTVALATGRTLWVDAQALEHRAQHALDDPGWLSRPANRRKLRRALGHYRGDLLADHDDDTLLVERERVRAVFLDASYQLAVTHARHGEWEDARSICRRLCGHEPLREDAQRVLIEAHARCGSRALAIRQYRTLERLLARELGVQPMPETVALAHRIAGEGGDAQPLSLPTTQVSGANAAAGRRLLLEARNQIAGTVAIIDHAIDQLSA